MAVSSITTASTGLLTDTSEAPETARLSGEDYAVLSAMLLCSAAIGIYYGFFNKRNTEDTEEFLMGGRSMGTFPVAMSLIASSLSAISVLGSPSEVYQRGFIFYIMGFSFFLVIPTSAYLYLPVFWNLQVTSAYEYLEIRFHSSLRRLASVLSIFQSCMYMAIVLYAPSLALSQVTGVNLYLSITIMSVVCMFYTVFGGIRAVLWTDTLQILLMFGMLIFILIVGTISVGGMEAVWDKAVRGGRAQLVDWDPNPTTRHTFWTLLVGGYFYWLSAYASNQPLVQRCLCVTELRAARRALWLTLAGLVTNHFLVAFIGLVIFAEYFDCDPLKSGRVSSGDQLMPLFVLDTMAQFKGLPGLFIAGVFSASLSTVSSGMNSLAAITLEDFIKQTFWKDISEARAMQLSKILSFIYGLIPFGLAFLAGHMGDIITACMIVNGVVGGPVLGCFTLGMFFPWANSIGCLVGATASIGFMLFVSVCQQAAAHYGHSAVTILPTSVNGCDVYVNVTTSPPVASVEVPEFLKLDLFQLSYLYYTPAGVTVTICVGLLTSFLVGKQDVRKLNPLCLSPGFYWMQKYLPGTDGIGEDYDPHPNLPDSTNCGVNNKAFEGDSAETQRTILAQDSKL